MVIFNRYIAKRMVLLTFVEGIIIFMTMYLSIALRFHFNIKDIYSFDPFFIKLTFFAVVCLASFYYFELYEPGYYNFGRQTPLKLVHALIAGACLLFVAYYFFPILRIGRGVLGIEIIIMPLSIMLWRMFYTRWVMDGLSRERVIILGTASLAQKLGTEIALHKNLGLEVVGFLDDEECDKIRSEENVSKTDG